MARSDQGCPLSATLGLNDCPSFLPIAFPPQAFGLAKDTSTKTKDFPYTFFSFGHRYVDKMFMKPLWRGGLLDVASVKNT